MARRGGDGGTGVGESHPTGLAMPIGGGRLVLVVLAPGGMLECDLPAEGVLTVGRSRSAQINIDDPSVSRLHAHLALGMDGPRLREMGSKNGTFVNGRRLEEGESPLLRLGDAILFGNVSAQLHLLPDRSGTAARLISPKDFDARLREEAERAVRYGHALTVITVATTADESLDTVDKLDASTFHTEAVVGAVRPFDLLTARAAGRLDVLLAQCDQADGLAVARRAHNALASRHLPARLGVATFPGNATSPERLVLAAEVAMDSIELDGVAAAKEASRVYQLGEREAVVAEPAMFRLFAMIERVASLPLPVLVVGETGTGKEIVAEALHWFGQRRGHPLVKLNCAALPEHLIESELFGYERGAFSGAAAPKQGLFEEADGGTIFLDEIGETSAALQAKLLRVLDDRRVRRLGATRDREVDVRVVAATNRDLSAAVAEGRFREDLFHRLDVIVMQLPPLRERPREMALLAERFAAETAKLAGLGAVSFDAAALHAMASYRWPGNIRELRNVVSRSVVGSGGGVIELGHLPPQFAATAGGDATRRTAVPRADVTEVVRRVPLDEELRDLERARILSALEASDGNQTRAAELLGLPRRTLVSRIAALGIRSGRARGSSERS